ncbi:MAG: ribonuclease HI [Deltaproteobacteria bacterium]|nr:ribonuclease HI [Deltaproteobacteria bacterium]
MPWVRARLRGQLVYARADERGELASESGRVEIRYRPDDGRLYRAAARNLELLGQALLPDATCAPAEPARRRSEERPAAAAPAGIRPDAGAPLKLGAGTADAVVAFTDGACQGNPGPAGLGVVVLAPGERIELSEYLGRGTNNVAELTAILRAADEIGRRPGTIFTDSKYAIGVVQKGWKAKANREIVADLRARLSGRGAARLVYVPGHAGVGPNERADELARQAILRRASSRVVHADKQ